MLQFGQLAPWEIIIGASFKSIVIIYVVICGDGYSATPEI
jgi:hypothetical protein